MFILKLRNERGEWIPAESISGDLLIMGNAGESATIGDNGADLIKLTRGRRRGRKGLVMCGVGGGGGYELKPPHPRYTLVPVINGMFARNRLVLKRGRVTNETIAWGE